MTGIRRLCIVLLACCLAALGLATDKLWARSSDLAAVVGCTELLQNGGFEAGGQGWLEYSAQGYELISDFNPRSGLLGAYLAGVNNADDRISQQVVLPAGTITLRAWWYLATAESSGVFDQMIVAVLRADGTWLANLLTVNNTAQVGVWDEIIIDLSSYAGQTVMLRFTGRTDDTNISDFYLDDVSVVACVADPSPTATATKVSPTATATKAPPTATPSETHTATATTARPTSTATATHTTTATAIKPTQTATATVTRGQQRCYLPWILRSE